MAKFSTRIGDYLEHPTATVALGTILASMCLLQKAWFRNPGGDGRCNRVPFMCPRWGVSYETHGVDCSISAYAKFLHEQLTQKGCEAAVNDRQYEWYVSAYVGDVEIHFVATPDNFDKFVRRCDAGDIPINVAFEALRGACEM